jgi:hypothetical protein
MAMKPNKKALETIELYNNLNGNTRQKWERVNQEGHNFYLDNQLTQVEAESLENQGMPTFTINRVIPIVEMLNFYTTTNQPRWEAVAVEGSDSDAAAVHSDVADYIWDISNGQAVLSQVINDSCTKSVGSFRVYVDKNSDNGLGDVKVDSLDPFDIYVDPQSRDIMFRDSSYVMCHKVVPRTQLLNEMPEYASKIKKANSQYPSDYALVVKSEASDFQYKDITELWNLDASQDEIMDYYELYYKVKVPYVNVFYKIEPSAEDVQNIRQTIEGQMVGVRDEMMVQLKEQQKNLMQSYESGEIIKERLDIEVKKAAVQAEATLDQKKNELFSQAIEQASSLEQVVVSKKEYNLLMKGDLKDKIVDAVPFFSQRIKLRCVVGDQMLYEQILPSEHYPIIPLPYKWTGTPYPMSAVAPLVGKQKELNKAHQLMIHNASLGSSLRWMYYEGSIDKEIWETNATAPGALLPVNTGYEPPKEVLPAQLSAAFASIVQYGKQDMEYLAGIYSSMQGDMSSQHDTYRGLLANDEYGTRRIKQWMTNAVQPSLKQLGTVVKDYAQHLYTSHRVFRLVQPNALQDVKEVEINVPLYNDLGEAIGKWKDYATARFDIRVVAGQTLPVNRWAYLGELKELLQLGVVDDIAVLAETDIKNKEKIVERKSLYAELQGQIGQMEEQLKNAEGTIETLERQVVQANIRNKVQAGELEMRKQVVDSSAKLRGEVAQAKADMKVARNNAKNGADLNNSGEKPEKPKNKRLEETEAVE